MRSLPVMVMAACAVVGLCVGSALCWRSGHDGGAGDFKLYVAPGTIAKSAACACVTLHTDVPYGQVEAVSVQVDGTDVEVAFTKADDRGNIVVKLGFDDVAALAQPPSATITLTLVVHGQPLVASETVPVTD